MTGKVQAQGVQSRSERKSVSKSLREQAPRSSHGNWAPAPDRPDPVGLLQAQDEGRLEHLLPIRYARMLESPFAFLRGSAVVMVADPATTPRTGIEVLVLAEKCHPPRDQLLSPNSPKGLPTVSGGYP